MAVGKNIVLLSDGTGNSSAALFTTNVWRLYEALDVTDPRQQVAYYDNGVGTSSYKPLAAVSGIFGFGLKRNVITIYSFLCRNYHEGDRIFGFGFSRGSFTMRVVAGLVASQGLVKYDNNEAHLATAARAAYRRYRAKFKTTTHAEALFRRIRDGIYRVWYGHGQKYYQNVQIRPKPDEIHFLGLWDTVDAYGGPIEEITRAIDYWFWPLSMPDRHMSYKIKRACHALSLDDERRAFWPVLWDETDVNGPDNRLHAIDEGWVLPDPKLLPENERRPLADIDTHRLAQVWFTGMHADVGGGYPQDGLSYVTLDWMMDRAAVYGLRLKKEERKRLSREASKFDKLNDSRHGLAGYYRYQPRKLETMYAAEPIKPTVASDLLYLGRTLIGNRRGRGGAGMSPIIHESVFERTTAAIDGYSPIVLPAAYRITTKTGDIVPGKYEHPTQSAMRASAQEKAWDRVWMRRVVYFLTVFASILLAFLPVLITLSWVQEKWPGGGVDGWAAFAIPIIELVDKFLPSFANPWIAAFKSRPDMFLAGAALVTALLLLGAWLQRRVSDAMRRIWRPILDSPPKDVGPSAPPSGCLHWVRTSAGYRGCFYALTHWILPSLCAIAIFYGGMVAVSRGLFALRTSVGWICKGNDQPTEITETQTTPVVFNTANLCQSTNLKVTKDQTYTVSFTLSDAWKDGYRPGGSDGIPTDPNGFAQQQKDIRRMGLGIPFRRHMTENWFRTIVRIGRFGLDEQPLTFTWAPSGTEWPKTYTATFKTASNGEVFLFVNDAVIGIPGLTGLFYGNNNGTATVTIKRGSKATQSQSDRRQ
jgi:uncharacterized protein (DUF2235 family)